MDYWLAVGREDVGRPVGGYIDEKVGEDEGTVARCTSFPYLPGRALPTEPFLGAF